MLQSYPSSGSLALSPNRPQWRALAGLPKPRLASRSFPHGLGASAPRRVIRVGRVGRMSFGPTRGMGAGTQAGVVAGSAILSAAPAAGPFEPIVAGVGELVSLISSFIGGGCGQACIASAQSEQIYEVACDDLQHVAQLGMLGKDDYLSGVQTMISAGQAALQQLQQKGDAKAADGLKNLSKSTSGNVSYASSLSATAATPLDLEQAQTAFISPGTAGWYSNSVVAGNQLALAYLQSLSNTSSLGVNATAGTISVLGMNFSLTELLIFAGLACLAYSFVE